MEVVFSPKASNDIEYWQQVNNRQVQERITALIESIVETPFSGLGKPEALKHNLKGFWSRRITQEHRLVYKVENNLVRIISLKGHY